jgi:hypothetical protein
MMGLRSMTALCGVISDRDLLRALSPYVGTASENARDTATLRKRVHQIMPVGIVSWRDVLKSSFNWREPCKTP